jgi:hypothetical protein
MDPDAEELYYILVQWCRHSRHFTEALRQGMHPAATALSVDVEPVDDDDDERGEKRLLDEDDTSARSAKRVRREIEQASGLALDRIGDWDSLVPDVQRAIITILVHEAARDPIARFALRTLVATSKGVRALVPVAEARARTNMPFSGFLAHVVRCDSPSLFLHVLDLALGTPQWSLMDASGQAQLFFDIGRHDAVGLCDFLLGRLQGNGMRLVALPVWLLALMWGCVFATRDFAALRVVAWIEQWEQHRSVRVAHGAFLNNVPPQTEFPLPTVPVGLIVNYSQCIQEGAFVTSAGLPWFLARHFAGILPRNLVPRLIWLEARGFVPRTPHDLNGISPIYSHMECLDAPAAHWVHEHYRHVQRNNIPEMRALGGSILRGVDACNVIREVALWGELQQSVSFDLGGDSLAEFVLAGQVAFLSAFWNVRSWLGPGGRARSEALFRLPEWWVRNDNAFVWLGTYFTTAPERITKILGAWPWTAWPADEREMLVTFFGGSLFGGNHVRRLTFRARKKDIDTPLAQFIRAAVTEISLPIFLRGCCHFGLPVSLQALLDTFWGRPDLRETALGYAREAMAELETRADVPASVRECYERVLQLLTR